MFNGYERTESQFRAILDAAGFQRNPIIPTESLRPISKAVVREDV